VSVEKKEDHLPIIPYYPLTPLYYFVYEWSAEVIAVGNEILTGRTVNTNSAFIAARLTSLGFQVRRVTVVGDEVEEIRECFLEALGRNPKLIISSGGLGPTYDDRTVEGLAAALGRKLVYNQEALSEVTRKYKEKGLELTEERLKMALFPEGATPIPNEAGIAPGVYVEVNNTEILLAPGVPKEMEEVTETFLRSYLKRRPNVFYYEESLTVRGVMESALAPHIKRVVREYGLYIKTHPKGHEINDPYLEVQIAGSSYDKDEITRKVKNVREIISRIAMSLGGKLT
jgi:molybdenum cofactor synthesis domain-containing protein